MGYTTGFLDDDIINITGTFTSSVFKFKDYIMSTIYDLVGWQNIPQG